jgi:hypothetical protein
MWLKNEDRNTKYYHACANVKQKKNSIYAIMDMKGRKWETSETVGMAFANYFSDLFTAGPCDDMKPCIGHIALAVMGEMNVELLKGFTNVSEDIMSKYKCRNIKKQERNKQETQDLRWFNLRPTSIH